MQIRGNQIDCGSVCKIFEKGSYLYRSYHINQCRRNNHQRKTETKNLTQIINVNKMRVWSYLIVKPNFKNNFLKRKNVISMIIIMF